MLGLLSPWLGSHQSAVGEISLSGPLNAKLLVCMRVLECECVFWCCRVCMLVFPVMRPAIEAVADLQKGFKRDQA